MRLTWKLALAYAWRHPARMLLTSAAVIAAACVVVWVVSGYDAIVGQFGHTATEYLGRYDLFVVPDSTEESFVPASLIESLRADHAVAELEPVLQANVRIQSDNPGGMDMGGPPRMASPRGDPGVRPDPSGMGGGPRGGLPNGPGMNRPGGPNGAGAAGPGRSPGGPGKAGPGGRPSGPGSPGGPTRRRMPFGSPVLVGANADKAPYKLTAGKWLDHNDPKLREGVLSDRAAEQLNVKVGDEVLVIFGTKEYCLKIIGITQQTATQPLAQRSTPDKPMPSPSRGATLGPASSALYVPLALAEKIARQTGKFNLVNIKLKDGVAPADFRRRWLPQAAQAQPSVLLVGVDDLKTAMEEGFMAARASRQAWAAMGMSLLAALFIIFTTLSMGVHERIRQFAMMRAVGLTRGQVARVIAAESLLLALIGWGGGLAAGWGLLTLLDSSKPGLFQSGAALGTWCVVLTGLSAFGGALIAAIFPAWQAMRVQPLEAMAPRRSTRPSMRFATLSGVAGLLLIAVNPLLVYVAPIPDATRYGIYEGLGCTSMALGFLLLTPAAIILSEAIIGPWLARLIGLDPRLLAAQLSSNLWRTLGTTVALTVGLGLYVAMMVWGYSMLQPFRPGDWAPKVLAAFQSGGLPDAEIDAMRHVQGVIPEQCLPLAVEQPRLAGDITGSAERTSVTKQDNVIIVGLDPEAAFGGVKPMFPAKFVQGTRDEAIAKLKQGRYCIVPDHFLWATGLKVGDRFGMVPPEKPDTVVEYTIAGAVELPGWHWMTKFSGLRRRSGRSAALIFAPYADVRRDFDIRQLNFFWMNLEPGAAVADVGAAMQPIADRNMGERQPVNMQGTWQDTAALFGPSLRISTPDQVRERITGRADTMIWAMCQLPLITLLVTSLGVINTIMASVRARRWEFGVLRAVGITRSALFRMVIAEGVLIGLVACLLSLAFGVMAGWCGTGISQYVSFFGGLSTPLFIPWQQLAWGFALTLGLCLAAALWPAFLTGRAEPLTLLQEGRAAM